MGRTKMTITEQERKKKKSDYNRKYRESKKGRIQAESAKAKRENSTCSQVPETPPEVNEKEPIVILTPDDTI